MKSILVIDKPIDCQSCRLVQHDRGGDYWCPLLGELEYDEMTKIHEDCPLKETGENMNNMEIAVACNVLQFRIEHNKILLKGATDNLVISRLMSENKACEGAIEVLSKVWRYKNE